MRSWFLSLCAGLLAVSSGVAAMAQTPEAPKKPEDFPPLDKVTEGFEKVVSTVDGTPSFYTLWKRTKDNQMLAELPKKFADQKHFIALTVSSGTPFAGLQSDDLYVYWRQYDKRLALIAPNTQIRSDDKLAEASVSRLFTDRVLVDVPILTINPNGGPVIDLDELLVNNASVFYGAGSSTNRPALARIVKAKAFPNNVEVAYEIPMTDGRFRTLHYSFSLIPEKTAEGYVPRKADERVGYFTTVYSDYGKYQRDETRIRFINRWHLEKRDDTLKASPPKKPIVFYIEHTTPVRYRRWVREGILYWNKAFEKIGIVNAIEVQQQDLQTNSYADLDPEDVRYNFVRWLNNDISTAIGPSRVHPETGQILDADIVLTDGWIRTFQLQFEKVMPKIAMEAATPETLAWLADHPNWDPRLRLASPSQRLFLTEAIARNSRHPMAGHMVAENQTSLLGDDPYDGLIGRTSQVNGNCLAAEGRSFDVAFMRMAIEMAAQEVKPDGTPKESGEQMLDGMPESFIGPLLADLVCHEVGHTLGLRHNFKASSLYTLEEMNSDKLKGKSAFAGSVMDYLPVNFNVQDGTIQGDYTMIGVGPYDLWAIEYGYTFDKDFEKVLKRVAEPELVYATDEDTGGPDPLARRYDFSKNPLDYGKSQIRLAVQNRKRILNDFVKDGQSWAKAREAYLLTLGIQTKAISMMANWIGGSFVSRARKGDPNAPNPVEPVPVQAQRDALKFVLENVFRDEAYGLSADLLGRMTVDKWLDAEEGLMDVGGEPVWPVHDRIMGIQATALTQLLNPTTLRRVYDNEFRLAPDQDALTMPELLTTVSKEIWSEFDGAKFDAAYSDRKPMVSSLRRNLQAEHVQRLFDLARQPGNATAAMKPIANLAGLHLKELKAKVDGTLTAGGDKIDPYTKSHLLSVQERIQKWVDGKYEPVAQPSGFFFGRSADTKE